MAPPQMGQNIKFPPLGKWGVSRETGKIGTIEPLASGLRFKNTNQLFAGGAVIALVGNIVQIGGFFVLKGDKTL
jgi:hypothetical protein